MKKLFPAKNPAIIKFYGRFDYELQEKVLEQLKVAFRQNNEPDGLILLIDSIGGEAHVLYRFINTILRMDLPCMGFVEDEAFSCGAELLLSCQYRVARPFAKIHFHNGKHSIKGEELLDPEVLSFIVANHAAQERTHLKRFVKTTGQTISNARAIYRADYPILATRAVELGILHEVTEEIFPNFDKIQRATAK